MGRKPVSYTHLDVYKRQGLTFAILPNLSEASAPAVLLHETAHSQQRADINQRGFDLVSNRERVTGPLRAFLDRVYGRLEKAGAVDDHNEYPNYIIEQAVLEGRQNGFNYADGKFLDWVDSKIGKGIGDFIRKVVNFIRATMLKRGFPININKLTVDDLVSFAQIGVERAAEGQVRRAANASAITMSQAEWNALTEDQKWQRTVAALQDLSGDPDPVSYTHLDVYKRQQ